MDQKAFAKLIAKEIWDRPTKFLGACVILGLMLSAAATYWRIGYDDTDGRYRSGLAIKTDCLTGLQYLTTGQGGLTPRLGVDGHQVKRSCDAS
jgi:hypothetical protein